MARSADLAHALAPLSPRRPQLRIASRRNSACGRCAAIAPCNRGVDLVAPPGSLVVAAREGRVTDTGRARACGWYVTVEHENSWRTVYCHLRSDPRRLGIVEGLRVPAMGVVGEVGSTGHSTGPHLHFTLLDDRGHARDPLPALYTPAETLEVFEADGARAMNPAKACLGDPASPGDVAWRRRDRRSRRHRGGRAPLAAGALGRESPSRGGPLPGGPRAVPGRAARAARVCARLRSGRGYEDRSVFTRPVAARSARRDSRRAVVRNLRGVRKAARRSRSSFRAKALPAQGRRRHQSPTS